MASEEQKAGGGEWDEYIAEACERCDRVRLLGEPRFVASHSAKLSKVGATIVICPECKGKSQP